MIFNSQSGDAAQQNNGQQPQSRILLLLAVAAAAIGIYCRLAGIGLWPLGIDEFYISRSIDNILRTGLPQFSCGGYYTRGILYQYVVALLRIQHLSAEFSGRLVSALASIASLPAAYLLARRLGGRHIGLLVLIVLSLSVWEIEMARFARMYAPFQAVFLWYLVFFLDYVLDKRRKALLGMIALSVVGVLSWEGGVFLGLLNLLPPLLQPERGRLRRNDLLYLVFMTALLCLLYLGTKDLRGFVDPPVLSGAAQAAMPPAQDLLARFWISWRNHPGWFGTSLLLIPFVLASTGWFWSIRDRWLAASGLAAALLAAVFHQYLAFAGVIVLLLLTQLIDIQELTQRPARFFRLAIGASAVFWTAFPLFTGAWDADISIVQGIPIRLLALTQHLFGFPDTFGQVVRPWARTLPLLALAIGVALVGIGTSEIRSPGKLTVRRVLIIVVVVMLLAIGTAATERLETRYSFFLYPLFLALAIAAVASFIRLWTHDSRKVLLLTGLATLGIFAATEDFQPRHLYAIDSPRVNFRIGMSSAQRDHYYPRSDSRSAAQWLVAHARAGEPVISGIPNIDQYYPHTDAFFLREGDVRYEAYACPGGTEERWTQRPLLYGSDSLEPKMAGGRRVFLVLYPTETKKFLLEASARAWPAALQWTSVDGGIDIIALNP